jgi:hypothetical protein
VEIGARLFAEFDCPVTTFVITGFLDRRLWLWWDRIAWVLDRTRWWRLHVELAGEAFELAWETLHQRSAIEARFVARCKQVPDAEKLAAILRLAAEADVELPDVPPPDCAPMTWEQLRASESRGMSFGPHSVTHPVLSRVDVAESRSEIVGSWVRLCEEARACPCLLLPQRRTGRLWNA